ncbi:MAG: TonB-dependent receptor [Bacteroidales bacterium]|nr:TonB-dependent receptor [Bacteroidales bacterium]
MINWQKPLVLFAIFMFTCSVSFGQKLIQGKVIDEDGAPVISATVIIEGTVRGASTDAEGAFSISAQVGQRIIVQFIGYKTKIIEIEDLETTIFVTLEADALKIDDLVVIGYGTQKKASVVGAISTAGQEDIKSQGNVSNMTDALTGVIPGVTVLSVSGMPGGDLESGTKIYTPSEILIRGKTTWNSASPLILVDGIERPMNDIDISEVESISVLKDASATAVFGVKGGNGVILITTKRGKEGKAKFNIEVEQSFETPSKMITAADIPTSAMARNYALERTRRFSNSVWNELHLSDEEIGYYRDGTYPYAYQNLDWQEELLKPFTKSSRVNLTTSGGTERVKYFASTSYNHVGDIMNSQDLGQGYLPEYSYDRFNVRSNFDFNITKTTKLQANFSGMHGIRNTPPSGTREGLFAGISTQSGDMPILVYEDGVYGSQDGRFQAANPYFKLNYMGTRTEPRTMINMDYTLDQKLDFITEGLSLSGKLAYDNTFRNEGRSVNDDGYITKTIRKDFYLDGGYYDYDNELYMLNGEAANMDEYTVYDIPTANEGFGWSKEPNTYGDEDVSVGNSERSLYYELALRYNRSFNKHSVTGLAMFSRFQYERGSNWPRKREDWVGRITYDYDSRYFMEVNGAYNGSEKFGPDYRFDFFPSIAGGWLLSNESFIEDNLTWIDNLKIRYSYGLVGNDNVNTGSTWPYLTIWDTYSFGSQGDAYYGYPSPYEEYLRYNEGNPGNPTLRWEKATKQNLGFEFEAFRNKISLTVDLFNEYRTDMLIGASDRQNTVPPIYGKPAPPANIGEAKSHGAEFELTHRNVISNKFNYWVSFHWAVARSEVIYKESTDLTLPHQKPEGFPIGQTRTGVSTGFINSWDDLYSSTGAAASADNGKLLPGDLIMLDFNSDGNYQNSFDDVPYGYPTYPQNNYGINMGGSFEGFDLSIRFLGAYNTTRRVSPDLFRADNLFAPDAILAQTWSPQYNNIDPTYPALAMDAKIYTPLGEFQRYDGSYLRLQSIQLSYTLPEGWTNKVKMNHVKLYVNGRNLFLWTQMPNDGVGLVGNGKTYPTKKQINFGLNIQF